MSDKYKKLKEIIAAWLDEDNANYEEIADKKSHMAGVYLGAIATYRQVLEEIEELEVTRVLS